jgi:DnaK suppressor protein
MPKGKQAAEQVAEESAVPEGASLEAIEGNGPDGPDNSAHRGGGSRAPGGGTAKKASAAQLGTKAPSTAGREHEPGAKAGPATASHVSASHAGASHAGASHASSPVAKGAKKASPAAHEGGGSAEELHGHGVAQVGTGVAGTESAGTESAGTDGAETDSGARDAASPDVHDGEPLNEAPTEDGDADVFLEHQRELLLFERNNYTRQAEELKAQAEALALEHEPGDVQFDEEGGEGGTANVDRELDLHLSAQAQAAIEEIDLALAKIAAGTYGSCENCGTEIPRARLEALPHARLCVSCKSGGLAARRQ